MKEIKKLKECFFLKKSFDGFLDGITEIIVFYKYGGNYRFLYFFYFKG